MTNPMMAFLLLTALAAGQATAVDDERRRSGAATVRTVDFGGKPPFERRLETVPAIGQPGAGAPAPAGPAAARSAGSADFRGRPPFDRRARADRAEGAASPQPPRSARGHVDFRGHPPFRRRPR